LRAEHAIRPAVVTRKVWGGNRRWRGAHAQQTLSIIIRTAHQRHLDPHAALVAMLHACEPIVPPAFQATTAS
jgi:transposase